MPSFHTCLIRRLHCGLVLLALLSASPTHAAVPSTLSYQGVLTDDAGNLVPDGAYALTFRLYAGASGGSALWTESHPGLAVNKGGFAVVLGSIEPLTSLFDRQLYLSVAVGADPELSPRVPLTPAPHALSLRLPYVGTANETFSALGILNYGTGHALYLDPGLYAGSSQHGRVSVGGPLRPYSMISLQSTAVGGGIGLWSAVTGKSVATFAASNAFSAGSLTLRDDNESPTVYLIGDASGPGVAAPALFLTGSSRSITLSTDSPGDASVVLPEGAISASEILDEPGITQGRQGFSVPIANSSTVTELMSTTITTPADGYILVQADAMHGLGGNGVDANQALFTIKDTPAGDIDFSHYTVSGFAFNAPNTLFRVPITLRRTYFKPAGTHTFYFQASAGNPSAQSNYVWQPMVTATFIPTSYGAVTTNLTVGDASVQGLAARAVAAASGPGGERGSGDAVQVDLRELELRAARLRAAALDAEKAALLAKLAQEPVPTRVALDAKDKP